MNVKSIFIVEDERIVALDLQYRLARLGHEITGSVATGEEALLQLEKVKPDLILMDIKLAGEIDGIDLAGIIHKRYGLPVIFVTAYSDEKTLARVKASGACGFIIKPFTDEELQATIALGVHAHELEEKLKQSEEQYRCLFDSAPVGYHEIDLQGNLVRVNQTELKMLGYKADEMTGRSVWDFVGESGLSRETVSKKLSTGKISSQPFERNYLHRDGRLIPVLIQDYPIRDSQGKLTGIRSTIQDISLLKEEQAKRKRLEESLRHSEKLESLGVMAGGLAHELNNQLMAIQGNASLALLGLPPETENRVYLQNVIASCQRSTTVLKQLMVCAGMDKGEFESLNISEVVAGLLPLLKKNIENRAELQFKPADKLPLIKGNSGQLKQLLTILVSNAAEAIKGKGGVIQIETGLIEKHENDNHGDFEVVLRSKPRVRGRYCYLSVTDNGEGMDEATRARLFDPFFITKGVGRGLGLPSALGIIKNHESDIEVKSKSGKGTTVRVVFLDGSTAET